MGLPRVVRFLEAAKEEGGARGDGKFPRVGAGRASLKRASALLSGAGAAPRACKERIRACRRPHLPGGMTREQVTPWSRRTVLAKAPHVVH